MSNSLGKILFITPQPFFAHRGSPLRVKATVTALCDLGFDVDLLSYPFGEETNLSRIKHIRAGRVPGITNVAIGPSWQKVILDISLSFKALTTCFKQKYIAIHGVEEAAVIGLVLSKLLKIPYVMDMHSHMTEQLQDDNFFRSNLILQFLKKCENVCIRNAKGILTVADDITNRALIIAPHTTARTGTDLPLESEEDRCLKKIAAITSSYNLEDKFVFLYTGNLREYQGIELLIRGFAGCLHALQKADSKLQKKPILLLVGGSKEELSELNFYTKLVHDLNIASHVVFTGPKPSHEICNFLEASDVLVSPRISGKNTPLKIYSYLSSGKLIVATNIRSHTQVLDDSSAFLCEPTPEDMGEKLWHSMFTTDKQKESLIKNCRALVEDKYNMRVFKQRVKEIYESFVDFGTKDCPLAPSQEPELQKVANVIR